MTAAQPNTSPRTLSVDELFARIHEGQGEDAPQQAADLQGAAVPNGVPSYAGPEAPPALENPADLQVAYEWLQSERQRLEAYTRSQFAAIQQQHQALIAKQFRCEEALALRSQELNREMKFLASQAERLQNRARELAEREAALTVHVERLTYVEQEFLNLRQTSNHLGEDTEAHRAVLGRLCADLAELRAAGAVPGSDAAAFEAALRERQQAWEKKQAALIALQEEMEERYLALEKAEEVSQRRQAELNDLEARMRAEFEEQENQLTLERREIEVLRAGIRMQVRKLNVGLEESEEDAVPV